VGSNVYIGGRILQSVRLLGNNLSTDAFIGGNLTVAAFPAREILTLGSRIEIRKNCLVKNDADLNASEIYLKGEVEENLRANGETVVIGGVIGGNAEITAKKKLVLEPSCQIEGTLLYTSPGEAEIQEGAQVLSGDIVFNQKATQGILELSFTWRIILGIGALLVGLFLSVVCRSKLVDFTDVLLQRFGQCIGIGVVSLAGMILYTALFVTTFMFSVFYKPVFVLIPLLALTFIVLVLAFYLSNILVAIFLGRIIITRLTGNKECSPGRSLILGLVIFTPIYAIPLAGNWIFVLATMLGFGALVMGLAKRLRSG